MKHDIIQGLINRGVITEEELSLVDNLDERLGKIAELNCKTDEFLKNATDEDFKMMFSECVAVKNCENMFCNLRNTKTIS